MLTFISSAPQPYTVSYIKGVKRTDEQSNTLHKWFGEIAQQRGDVTFAEVKAECNLQYGVPIKRRDDAEWASAFGYLFDKLSHAAKLKALRVLDVPVTRDMKVKQLSEYMDQLFADAQDAGWVLTIPKKEK